MTLREDFEKRVMALAEDFCESFNDRGLNYDNSPTTEEVAENLRVFGQAVARHCTQIAREQFEGHFDHSFKKIGGIEIADEIERAYGLESES